MCQQANEFYVPNVECTGGLAASLLGRRGQIKVGLLLLRIERKKIIDFDS